jgi:hypothetical protein
MHSDYNTTELGLSITQLILCQRKYIIGPPPFTNEQGNHFLRVRQGSRGKMGQRMERP